MNQLKAESPAASSRSIVLGFESRWRQSLVDGKVSVVFRKKGPVSTDLDYVYAYVGLSVGEIVGRAKVTNYAVKAIADALSLTDKGCLSERDLKSYVGHDRSVGVFVLSKFELAQQTVSSRLLKQRFGFVPPQRFFFLSKDGKRNLDLACGFRPLKFPE